MALNRLSLAQMANLTSSWAQPRTTERMALERIPGMPGLLPHFEEVLDLVLAAERMTLTMTLSELTQAVSVTDDRHDNYARAIEARLMAEIFLARANGDHARAQQLERIRAFLFPDGLRVVSYSYREESGQAELLARRLEDSHRDVLRTVTMDTGTLVDTVDRWIETGRELGHIENMRDDQVSPTRQKNMAEARSAWIQMIHTVRAIVRTAKVTDPDVIDVLHRIERAEIAAERAGSPDTRTPGAETPTDGDQPGAETPETASPPAGDPQTGEEPAPPAALADDIAGA